MTQRVLVVGHSDVDGHLIAEQIGRNLSLVLKSKVDVVVDPERTKDHKAWLHLELLHEVDGADPDLFR